MYDDFVDCPYNGKHRVLAQRLPLHIIKCKRNYRGPPLDMCPFNATHLLPPSAMKEHVANCPDAIQFQLSQRKILNN